MKLNPPITLRFTMLDFGIASLGHLTAQVSHIMHLSKSTCMLPLLREIASSGQNSTQIPQDMQSSEDSPFHEMVSKFLAFCSSHALIHLPQETHIPDILASSVSRSIETGQDSIASSRFSLFSIVSSSLEGSYLKLVLSLFIEPLSKISLHKPQLRQLTMSLVLTFTLKSSTNRAS